MKKAWRRFITLKKVKSSSSDDLGIRSVDRITESEDSDRRFGTLKFSVSKLAGRRIKNKSGI